MKSLLWSLLIMVIVFIALKLNVTVVLEGHALFYVSIIGFIGVIGCAMYFVGLPKKDDISSSGTPKHSSSDVIEEPQAHQLPPAKEQENEEK